MRIIDQNGYDYPYESIVISHGDGMIYARPVSNMEKRYFLARYSTEEKAEKAMQKLRECYLGIHVVEKLNDTVDCSSLSQIGIYKKNENGDYAYKLPVGERIFRFSQDDEL